MLYDPEWENQWSLPRFIAFGETKPPDERYDFTEPRKCAAAQFRIAYRYLPINLSCDEIPLPFRDILNPRNWGGESEDTVYTWGALVRRARAVADRAAAFA